MSDFDIIMENNKHTEQPFIASCVDAGESREACTQVLGDLEGIHAYLKQGRQYLGSGEDVNLFEEEVVKSIRELDQISNRLRRREADTPSSDPIL